ncbi:hypothetical protein KA107_02110 [Candidatus Pacearchaeota archaeon]|nr:hypothetical protein [Candidatus Pacearchaeota archaeon]
MDPIKEAFLKIKEDISSMQLEISQLKQEISSLKLTTSSNLSSSIPAIASILPPFQTLPTNNPAQNPAVPQEIRGLENQKNDLSTGNKGVPTDTSTYRQTNQQTDKMLNLGGVGPENSLERIQRTLDSLDSIRREIRLKFKRLTPQEMLVFTTIYSLENEGVEEITYRAISSNLNLTESSIRDYITKLLQKGVPLKKIRLNNKKIVISVSEELKKLASLSTIIKLREV